jgi:hypothetical protein
LKEVAPRLARVAALFNPKTHTGQYWNVAWSRTSRDRALPTGLPAWMKTIGVVRLSRCNANAAGVLSATATSGAVSISSLA